MDQCIGHFNGGNEYEILHGTKQFTVQLDRKTCSCRRYTISGIPCAHAICAIRDRKANVEDFVSSWYHKDVYLLAYGYPMEPMQGMKDWPKVDEEGPKIQPPEYRRMLGRPKTARRKDPNEFKKKPNAVEGHMSRKGMVMTCQLCQKEGHNKRGCPFKGRQGQQATSAAKPSPSTFPNMSEQVETSHGRAPPNKKLTPKRNHRAQNKGGTVAASVSKTVAEAEAEFSGIGSATCAATFNFDPINGSNGNASANASSSATVPTKDSTPHSLGGHQLDASNSNAKLSKPPRAKALARKVAGRCWVDADGRIMGSTDDGIRTSPKSKAKFSGVSFSKKTTNSNATTVPSNWSQTISSSSSAGGKQSETCSRKRTRMEGIGLYTNLKTGREILNPGRLSQKIISKGSKPSKEKRKAIAEPEGTQESNNSTKTSKGKEKAP